jgi:hypothetical protein
MICPHGPTPELIARLENGDASVIGFFQTSW